MYGNHFLEIDLIFAIVKTDFLASRNHFFYCLRYFSRSFSFRLVKTNFPVQKKKYCFYLELFDFGRWCRHRWRLWSKKRAKYIPSCKDRVWLHWTKEYRRGLKEQRNLIHNSKELKLKEGDVVIIRGNKKNRTHWKTGIFHQLLPGSGDITRTVKLQAGKSYLERAVQYLYPLELRSNQKMTKETN